jgi:CARDB protein
MRNTLLLCLAAAGALSGVRAAAVRESVKAPERPSRESVKASERQSVGASARQSVKPRPQGTRTLQRAGEMQGRAGAQVRPYEISGPLDVPLLLREKRAVFSHSKLQAGSAEQLFDGNRYTSAAVPAGEPVFFQVVLDRPRSLDAMNVTFVGAGSYQWTAAGADTPADMEARRGSYGVVVLPRAATGNQADPAIFTRARAYRVYRLECRQLSGAGGIEVGEWSLWSPQVLSRIQVDPIVATVARGGKLQLRANGWFEAGARQNLTPDVVWEVSPPSRGRVDDLDRFEGLEPGTARVTARFGTVRSPSFEVQVLAEGRPDWDIIYIERLPHERLPHERLPHSDYDGSTAEPKAGDSVYWVAHIKNYGTGESGPVVVEWRMDGKAIRSGRLPKLERFCQTEVILTTEWDGKRHELELVVDPQNEVAETSEGNNRLKIYTDALSVGFWVEESTYRYFLRNQHRLGIGSNSWEDWAQRQIEFWNRWMEKTAWLGLSPHSGGARWRLDRIIVVGDRVLPLAGGSPIREPDRREKSVRLMWGFPAYSPDRSDLYRHTSARTPDNPFYLQPSLVHAMASLRPLPDSSPVVNCEGK